jgi:hypothetical protein
VKDLILSLQNHTEAIDLSIEKTKNGEPDEDHINFSLSGIYEWENLDEYTLEVDTYIPLHLAVHGERHFQCLVAEYTNAGRER